MHVAIFYTYAVSTVHIVGFIQCRSGSTPEEANPPPDEQQQIHSDIATLPERGAGATVMTNDSAWHKSADILREH